MELAELAELVSTVGHIPGKLLSPTYSALLNGIPFPTTVHPSEEGVLFS